MSFDACSSSKRALPEDVIQRRRDSSDLYWCLRSTHPTTYKFRTVQTAKQIKEHVLKSERVQNTIAQLAEENGKTLSAIEAEAKAILDEMGHNFSMGTVRGFGFVLSKLMRQLFTEIIVNRDGIERLRAVVHEHPIVYMPTHRSYVDFLILSYVCFTYGLPVPVIAAGMDFMAMKGMSIFLRNAGAFFIRRTFGNDRLYWNIFSEYVQIHVRNGIPPVEFFVEGTRSRSGKSLVPKLGFLSSVVEPFFKSELTDVAIVPISINYDRTLEEILYSYELLGVPKPKETTKGLLKARQILNENFGVLQFNMGDPIILSEFCRLKGFKRLLHPGPKYLFTPTAEEQYLCKLLAYQVVREHQNNAVLSPFTLMASLLLTNVQMGNSGIPLSNFIDEILWLKQLITDYGGHVYWKESENTESIIRHTVSVHHMAVELKPSNSVVILQPVQMPVKAFILREQLSSLKGHCLTDVTLSQAVPSILLSHYNNQLLHVFIRPALVAVILAHFNSGCERKLLFTKYSFLEQLLSQDFIFEPEETENAFTNALTSLEAMGLISFENDYVRSSVSHEKVFTYFTQLLDPFFIVYKVVCQVLLQLSASKIHCTPVLVIREAQACIEQLLLKKQTLCYVALSLDILNNAVLALVQMKVIGKENKGKQTIVVTDDLASVSRDLGELTWLTDDCIKDHINVRILHLCAKL